MKECSEDQENTVINTIRKGRSQTQIAKDFDLLRKIINTWNKTQLPKGSTVDKQRPGRPCKIMLRTKNVMWKLSKADSKKIVMDFNIAVKLVLRESNLHGRQPCKKSLIFAKNRKAQFQFARAHKDWTPVQWARVLFRKQV